MCRRHLLASSNHVRDICACGAQLGRFASSNRVRDICACGAQLGRFASSNRVRDICACGAQLGRFASSRQRHLCLRRAARTLRVLEPRPETSMLSFLHVVSLQYIVLFSTLSVFPFFYEKNKKYSKKTVPERYYISTWEWSPYLWNFGNFSSKINHSVHIYIYIYIAFGRCPPYLWNFS